MPAFARTGRWAALTASIMLVTPPRLVVAAEPVAGPAAPRAARAAPVSDVSLEADGSLRGQAVDMQGRPLAGAAVVLEDGRVQATATTDAHGQFRFTSVRGGVYRVKAGQQMKICRAWKAGTAPPAANRGLMIVDGNQAVLGQYCTSPVGCGSPVTAGWEGAGEVLKNPLVIGGLIAAAIAIPVALHHSDDDDPAS